MYMSKNEEKALAYLIEWTKQKEINQLVRESADPRPLQALVLLETYCIKAKKEREQTNARTWEYIKEKRKSNPDYARPKKEAF